MLHARHFISLDAYKILVGKPEDNTPLGTPRHR
jgi:hypothetical protein